MNPTTFLSRLSVLLLVFALCACSHAEGLSGTYSGKNAVGSDYKVEFVSNTDCIITTSQHGQMLATYKVTGIRVLVKLANGGSGVFTKTGNSLSFIDDGFPVLMNKN